MESQMQQEHPQHVASDTEMVEDQAEHGEKKSMLKKVKDKAKKIKDTIKKHGLGQEDDADEERITNPAVHGAPDREPTDTREDRYHHSNVKGEEYTSLREKGVTSPPQAMETEFERPKPETQPDVIDARQVQAPQAAVKPATASDALEEDPREDISPSNYQTGVVDSTGQDRVSQPAVKPETTSDVLEEDPHSLKDRSEDISPSNYQTKVVDPTGQGGKEADVGSLTQGLKNVSVSDEFKSSAQQEQTQSDESKSLPEQERPRSYTGSHDQFAPQSTPTEESLLPESHPVPEDEPKSHDPNHPESMPRDTVTGKISSASAVIVDKAASAKNSVASKLGYGNQTQESSDANTQQKKPLTESAAEYKNMVAEKLTPVYEKVSGAGTAVMSKVRGSGTNEQQGGGGYEASKGSDKGVSVKDYLSDKFKPGDEDKALSKAISEKLQVKKKSVDENESKTNELSPGVVSSLKGVVGSWLGKSTGTKSADDDDQSRSRGSEETAAQEEANFEQKMKQ